MVAVNPFAPDQSLHSPDEQVLALMTDKQIGLSRPVEGLCRRLTAIVRIERGKDQLAQVLLVHRTDRVGADAPDRAQRTG